MWQGDSGSSTGPLLPAMAPGRSTNTHCSSSSSACWLTGRPMGAWDWLASPQALGTKSLRETRLKTKESRSGSELLHAVVMEIHIVQRNPAAWEGEFTEGAEMMDSACHWVLGNSQLLPTPRDPTPLISDPPEHESHVSA